MYWTFLSTGARAALQIVVLVVLARLLDPTAFGIVGAALVMISVSLLLSQLGISLAIVQTPHLQERHIASAFLFLLLSGATVFVAIQLIAPFAQMFFRMEGLSDVVRVLSLIVLIENTSEVAFVLLHRDLEFKRLAGITIVSYGIGFGMVGIIFAFLGFGVWALVAARLVQATIRSAVLLVIRPHPKALRVDLSALKDLMYFGSGMTAWRIANTLALQLDNLIVGYWLGAQALGLYQRAYQLVSMPAGLVGGAMITVLYPALSTVQREHEKLALAYHRSVSAVAIMMLPLAAGVLVLAPELVAVLLGAQWKEAVLPLRILAFGTFLVISCTMSDSIAAATGAVYQTAWRQAVYALAVFGGALIGCQWGLGGVAAGVLIALAINFLLMAQLSLKLTLLRPSSFVLAHVRAIPLAALIAGELWALSEFFRLLAVPPMGIIVASLILAASTVVLMIRAAPSFALGSGGAAVLGMILENLPPRLAIIRRVLNVYEAETG